MAPYTSTIDSPVYGSAPSFPALYMFKRIQVSRNDDRYITNSPQPADSLPIVELLNPTSFAASIYNTRTVYADWTEDDSASDSDVSLQLYGHTHLTTTTNGKHKHHHTPPDTEMMSEEDDEARLLAASTLLSQFASSPRIAEFGEMKQRAEIPLTPPQSEPCTQVDVKREDATPAASVSPRPSSESTNLQVVQDAKNVKLYKTLPSIGPEGVHRIERELLHHYLHVSWQHLSNASNH